MAVVDATNAINFASLTNMVIDPTIFPSWKALARPLMLKARIKAKHKLTILRKGSFSDAINLDKLFRERECDSSYMNDNAVKEIFVKFVFTQLRLNFNDVSPNVIRRILRKFYLDDNFNANRSEALDFLNEVSIFVPPVFCEARQFWIDVFVDSSKGLCFNRALAEFGVACYSIFNDEKYSIEYQEYLLGILEFDYAGIHTKCAEPLLLKGKKTKDRKKTQNRDRVKITEIHDLDRVPLAFFAITNSNDSATLFWVPEDYQWLELLLDRFVEDEKLRRRRLYARLIGLLLDINTFVFFKEFYNTLDRVALDEWRFVPTYMIQWAKLLSERLKASSPKTLNQFEELVVECAPFICGMIRTVQGRAVTSKN